MPAEPAAAPLKLAAVQRLAHLARLTLEDGEAAAIGRDMDAILAHCQRLAQLDLAAVPATAHATHAPTALREDVVHPGLSAAAALAAAPERLGDGFGVPKILE